MSLEFLPQCCDAIQYLGLADHRCLAAGDCYDSVRPMGSVLWYSWLGYLGFPLEYIIIVHWILLAVSVSMSALAMHHWLRNVKVGDHYLLQRFFWVALPFSVVIHVFLFWPTIAVSLSDTPAAIFLLIGIWSLFLSQGERRASWLWWGLAGLSFGMAAWIRVFYLYPVLLVLLLWLVVSLARFRQRKSGLIILVALIPILTQVFFTYREYNRIGFLSSSAEKQYSSMHLTMSAAGFDTVMPGAGYFWMPPCGKKIGISVALEQRDFVTLGCLLWGRLNFYMGSYAKETYMFATHNKLHPGSIEEVGNPADWGLEGLTFSPFNPGGITEKKASKLVTNRLAGEGDRTFFQWVSTRANIPHTFSVWMWAADVDTLDMILYQHPENLELARKTVTVTTEPTRFFVTATPIRNEWIGLKVGATLQNPVSFGQRNQAELYVRGAQLEWAETPGEYEYPIVVNTDFRIWSFLFLMANIFAVIVACFFLWIFRPMISFEVFSIVLLAALCLGEALVIVPEQRFVIVPLTIVWMVALTGVGVWVSQWRIARATRPIRLK